VIKLKDILNEIIDIEYGRSWLSPDGKFISTNDGLGHIISHPSKAIDIVPPEEWDKDEVPVDYLYKQGWQRVVSGKLGQYYVGGVLFCSNPYHQPNQKQKSELIQFAKDHKMNQLIYDNETLRPNPYTVLWSKDDVLQESSDEEKYKKMAYSWQRPDGTFIPVRYSHGSDAWEIAGKQPNTDYCMIFWKRGWNRIWYNIHTLFCHNEVQFPNDNQKAALIDLAINMNLEKVEYDSGNNSKILWSVHDILENLAKLG
jgi:hypothetical protein